MRVESIGTEFLHLQIEGFGDIPLAQAVGMDIQEYLSIAQIVQLLLATRRWAMKSAIRVATTPDSR